MRRVVSHITSINFNYKTVLLRIDGNVPLKQGKILDDFRLEKMNKTLRYLIDQNACVIVLTHIGNPEKTTEDLSTKQLLTWFTQRGYETIFCAMPDILDYIPKKPGTVILFENTRLFKEEKSLSPAFAQKLAKNAEYYIFDAFGALHRNETTIALLPLQFPPEKRTIGFLVQEEYNILASHLDLSPSVLIVGGGKPDKKINEVIACSNYIDTILLCPLLSTLNKELPDNVINPVDYIVRKNIKGAPLETIPAHELTEKYECVSIGEKTVQLFTSHLQDAKLIIWNGFMGFLEQKETLKSSEEIAKTIAQKKGYSIIAGGNTVAFIRSHIHLEGKVSALLTGGGATLFVIARKNLPGLEAFL